jgi:hypothetical protein
MRRSGQRQWRLSSGTLPLQALARRGATVIRLTPSGKQPFRERSRDDRWAAAAGADLVRATRPQSPQRPRKPRAWGMAMGAKKPPGTRR